ncbi:hypothetical protein [Pseudomonas sp. PB106]|uniref:hypothetical protein n=1 Tax=Pseudomonas sp. PB106 TaxID=2494699 RepID=UPI00131C1EF7|nr:hypothetical protein [Pseudomonas sp. PB106]KAE9638881.1 hypothetical protein EJA71_26650 [Pseudomonas sp. PB106]
MTQAYGKKSADYLDPTFANGGVLDLPLEGSVHRVAQSVLSLPEKKLLLLLSAAQGNPPATARLNEDGSVDRSFADNGFADLPYPEETQFPFRHLQAMPDGCLVLGIFDNYDLIAVRQLGDGRLDTSFGPAQDGRVIIRIRDLINPREGHGAGVSELQHRVRSNNISSADAGNAGIRTIAQQDGKIILVSTVEFGANYGKGILVRLNADGSLDGTFNEKGYVLIELPGISHDFIEVSNAVVQQDGKILVGGYYNRPDEMDNNGFVIRYNQNGSIDSSYGDDKTGVVDVTDSGRSLQLRALALKPDGGLVAVGVATTTGGRNSQGLTLSLNPAGSFNLVFNNGKPLFADFTEYGVRWGSCVPQTDGKLVVSGQGDPNNHNSHSSTVTARYTADGSLDQTFAGKGWADYNGKLGEDIFRGCVVMDDQRTVVTAYTAGAPAAVGYVLRYLA